MAPNEKPTQDSPLSSSPNEEKNIDPSEQVVPTDDPEQDSTLLRSIVGIGASAGGLEAFEKFFRTMPTDCGAAIVLIQHMSPDHESSLAEIIGQYTDMPVSVLNQSVDAEANHIYITPPNRNIGLLHGRLLPIGIVPTQNPNLPIDFFFRELARDQKERSACIVLSGTGSDGSAGLQAIHAAGGLVMSQEPSTAASRGMPESAIATNMVDHVLPVEEMPPKLVEYTQHKLGTGAQAVDQNISSPVELLQQIFILVRAKTGYDFSYYKQNTIGRRIKRRMTLHQIVELQEYVQLLQQNADEVDILFRELLIGVTSFFRDQDAFNTLEELVIPSLFAKVQGRQQQSPDMHNEASIRIWVPGCATGEEAYSIAILLQEYMDVHRIRAKVQIFATDIDNRAIEKARIGRYPRGIALDISPKRLSQYFEQVDDHYVVTKSIRDMIIFAEQSVIKDPPFSKLDLISCRNLMIYWNSALQKMVLPVFHYALKLEGYLFLGTSETVGEYTHLFQIIDQKSKIFSVRPYATKIALPLELQTTVLPTATQANKQPRSNAPVQEALLEFRDVAEAMLFPDYLPSSLIIDSDGEVKHFFGRTGKYLEPAPGDSSFNILDMARPGLRPSLATAIRKAKNLNEQVLFEDIQVKTNGDYQLINLRVWPIDDALASHPNLQLVIFEDMASSPLEPEEVGFGSVEGDVRVKSLERELSDTKEFLQTTIEELETANEELRSTNEELQSANEELQSTNEELETSKEELQSLNEELVTVNTEHQDKIQALSETNNDLNNLLSSTDIATIFLDTNLCVKRFTEAATNIIHLIDGDVGRPLAHIVTKMLGTSLVDEAAEVLRTLVPHQTEVETESGHLYLMQITPYRTTDNVVQGVVLTFIDLTDQKAKEKKLAAAERGFDALAADTSDTVYIFDIQSNQQVFFNADGFLGYTLSELTAPGSLMSAVHPDDKGPVTQYWEQLMIEAKELLAEYRVKHKSGQWEWIQSSAHVIATTAEGRPGRLLFVLRIITDQRSGQTESD